MDNSMGHVGDGLQQQHGDAHTGTGSSNRRQELEPEELTASGSTHTTGRTDAADELMWGGAGKSRSRARETAGRRGAAVQGGRRRAARPRAGGGDEVVRAADGKKAGEPKGREHGGEGEEREVEER